MRQHDCVLCRHGTERVVAHFLNGPLKGETRELDGFASEFRCILPVLPAVQRGGEIIQGTVEGVYAFAGTRSVKHDSRGNAVYEVDFRFEGVRLP